jgi:predicted nucleotidyltransferase
MLSTSDPATGAERPLRVQRYIEALVQTCAQTGAPLVSVVLFGSAAKGGFSEDVSDVDVIIVVSNDASRAKRLRLGARMWRPLRPSTTYDKRRLVRLDVYGRASSGRWVTGSPALSAHKVTCFRGPWHGCSTCAHGRRRSSTASCSLASSPRR